MPAEIREDPGLFALLLEATQRALEGLTIFDSDTGQKTPPSLPWLECSHWSLKTK
jgi:hypothetical protein